MKVKQLHELIRKLGLNINEVIFVGDSENDIEAFKETGHGIAVCSSNDYLKKLAWRKADSLKQIKKIL